MGDDIVLQPECYKRHERFDSHIESSKFWRGVIVAAILSGIGILIAQYNMSIQNNNRMIEANAKLTQMVEINTARLVRLENAYFVK